MTKKTPMIQVRAAKPAPDYDRTKEASSDGQSDEFAKVILGVGRQETERVHSRDSADEEDTDSTSRCGSRLESTILLGSEWTAEDFTDDAGLREGPGHGFNDGETEDGL